MKKTLAPIRREADPDPHLLSSPVLSRTVSSQDEGGSEDDDDDVDVNERDRDGYTPLHVALSHGHADCAKALLEAGAAWYAVLEGSPALHLAVATAAIPQHADASLEAIVTLLAIEDFDALVTDDYGRSALHLAAGHGLGAIAAALLEQYRRPPRMRTSPTR